MFKSAILVLLLAIHVVRASDAQQVVFRPSPGILSTHGKKIDEAAITAALKMHPDPVDALLSLDPDRAGLLAESRLLHVIGESEPRWWTEGDKLRLWRQGKKFMDITEHEDFYANQEGGLMSGKPSTSS